MTRFLYLLLAVVLVSIVFYGARDVLPSIVYRPLISIALLAFAAIALRGYLQERER